MRYVKLPYLQIFFVTLQRKCKLQCACCKLVVERLFLFNDYLSKER